ncbi:hypothetical protein [Niabella drilacis]|uniref:Uncharacterized protein n=1 Tax=Niabella drilacis (strain DSM 25811 / CCM 8410 / CCUG 62505 / LMG 26954 / E90) TaxID=1285928 RepID=A0A1G6MTT8_NIADE|nr:hypothetical protein [Niabella drilacis]SDC58627.1 hypothetical protein SAMN04487894_10326 [Niabella drilacis]
MKHNPVLAAIIFAGVTATAFIPAADIISRIGISQDVAKNHILNNLVGNFRHEPVNPSTLLADEPKNYRSQTKRFQIPRLSNLPQLINGNKKAMAKELCLYVKEYVNSREFADKYAKIRAAAKPEAEPPVMDKQTIDAMKQGLKESETARTRLKAMGQSTKSIDTGIAQMKKMISENGDPTPNKTKWEKLYPADPAVMIKNRLQEYISLAATVDFNAAVTGAKRTFINPAYENQTLRWKAIYRAGKEVNDVAIAFAKQWLKEGIITY